MPESPSLAPTLSGQRETSVNRPIPITPMARSLLTWLHGPAAADELIRKATSR